MTQKAFQCAPSPAQQTYGRTHRAYTISQLCEVLELPRRTFFRLRRTGQLPFLRELQPRLGRTVRYRAEPIDRYLAGQWQQPRSFGSARSHVSESAAHQAKTVWPKKRQFDTLRSASDA